LRQLALGALQQCASGAGRPRAWVDVDRVHLAGAVDVAARPDRDEADNRAIPLRDERRPARRWAAQPLAPARDVDEAAAVEIRRREDVAIRGLPAALLDARDPLRVAHGCGSDLHRAT